MNTPNLAKIYIIEIKIVSLFSTARVQGKKGAKNNRKLP